MALDDQAWMRAALTGLEFLESDRSLKGVDQAIYIS